MIYDKDWPQCARCEMPVEEFYALTIEPTGPNTQGGTRFVARCHNDEQVVDIPDSILVGSKLETVEFGPAFAGQGQK